MTNKLKEIRAAQQLSLEALSEMSGITGPGIHKIENGAEPKIGTAYAIAGALGKKIHEVFPSTLEFEEVKTVTKKRMIKRG